MPLIRGVAEALVFEDVAEMPAALRTDNFRPHPILVRHFEDCARDALVKRGPAASGIELRFGGVQVSPAPRALEYTVTFLRIELVVLSGCRILSTCCDCPPQKRTQNLACSVFSLRANAREFSPPEKLGHARSWHQSDIFMVDGNTFSWLMIDMTGKGVPFIRSIRNCSGDRIVFHSPSVTSFGVFPAGSFDSMPAVAPSPPLLACARPLEPLRTAEGVFLRRGLRIKLTPRTDLRNDDAAAEKPYPLINWERMPPSVTSPVCREGAHAAAIRSASTATPHDTISNLETKSVRATE